MSTFGNVAARTATSGDIEDYIRGFVGTCTEVGTADSITIWVGVVDTAHKIKCALYQDSDDSFVGETEERTIAAGTAGEETFNFSAPKPSLTAQDYAIVAWAEATGGTAVLGNSGYGSGASRYDGHTYNGWPAPYSPSNFNWKSCTYCTYTAGGAPPAAEAYGYVV